jgi:hypothetical protein
VHPPTEGVQKFLIGFCGTFCVIIVLALVGSGARAADWNARSIREYDRLFQRTNGWTGADGDFAVTLTNGLTLWLFSDTFVSDVHDHRRANAVMINNSAAWQHGTDPASAHLEFFYATSADGKPRSLITPADGKGWFWLFDGAMNHGKLFLFLVQIERIDEKSVFGFRQIGLWLGEVSNPLAPPTQWHIEQKKIPFAQFTKGERRSYGSAMLRADGFIYIFGTRERLGRAKTMIVARIPAESLGDFTAWEFRTQDGWTTNAAQAADLCNGVASEYSVSWLPALRQFVLIYSENGLSPNIMARTARHPWGPWSEPATIYRCPEAAWDTKIFCYAAKAHPTLTSAPDELIITYAANSFEFSQVINDTRLYWPRFVRLNWRGTYKN